MNETVFWAREPLPPISAADQELPEAVDVAVIGAGYTGLAAARNLAKGGAKVAVLEKNTVGWGASGRNGGMVSVGSKRTLGSWIQGYGHDFAQRLYKASIDSVTFVEELIKKEKIDCSYERCGLLMAAWKPEHFGALAKKQQLLHDELGYETKLVAPVDQAEELGTRGYHGALLDEFAGRLDPLAYTRGLAKAAIKAKATVHEGTEVLSLGPEGDGHLVVTSRGALKADEILVATNSYTSALTPELQRRVIPIASQIIATEPLGEELATSLIPKRRIVFDSKKMLFYYRVTDDHRMLFGGRASFSPISAQKSGQILRDHMVGLYPQLDKTQVEFTWEGFVAFTFDMDPHLGRRDGLYYSMGYCGHGIALGTYMGDRIGNVIAGRPEDVPFLDLPFPANPLYRSKPWFVPIMGGYYRIYDRLK